MDPLQVYALYLWLFLWVCLYLVVIRSLIRGILSPGQLRSWYWAGIRIQGIIVLDHYTVFIRGDSSFGDNSYGGSRITLNRGIDAIVRYILLLLSCKLLMVSRYNCTHPYDSSNLILALWNSLSTARTFGRDIASQSLIKDSRLRHSVSFGIISNRPRY